MKISFNDLKRGFELYKAEYEEAALRVLRSGWYILGDEVKSFEDEFAKANEIKHCVGVDNGLNAIALGIHSLGISYGDEVILQANTYIATVLGITHNNATPVFVEPDEFYNIDASKIEEKITSKTKAVLVTHLYGQAAEMNKIVQICRRHKLFLIEDCAQAHFAEYKGQKIGTFGHLGFFSFYPTKNLGGFGDGGAVITNDDTLAQSLRVLRNYGSNRKYYNETVGNNSRLDELQAGLLRVKLLHIRELEMGRNEIASKYLDGIKNQAVMLPKVRKGSTHIWHLFVVRNNNRDKFRKFLHDNDIVTDIHYPVPPHLSVAYKHLGYTSGDFPITEEYADTVVSLPIFNGMKTEEVEYVISVVNQYQG